MGNPRGSPGDPGRFSTGSDNARKTRYDDDDNSNADDDYSPLRFALSKGGVVDYSRVALKCRNQNNVIKMMIRCSLNDLTVLS